MTDWRKIKHFKPGEFVRPELLRPMMAELLDDLRETYGRPLVVSSSWRDPAHNKDVGGKSNSSHIPAEIDGLYSGVDLTTPRNVFTKREYYWIVKAAFDVGYRRIGLYKDFKHIHLDCEERLDQDVLWID